MADLPGSVPFSSLPVEAQLQIQRLVESVLLLNEILQRGATWELVKMYLAISHQQMLDGLRLDIPGNVYIDGSRMELSADAAEVLTMDVDIPDSPKDLEEE